MTNREFRAPKGWTFVASNSLEWGPQEDVMDIRKREHKANKAIRSVKRGVAIYNEKTGEIDPVDLKKEGDAAAADKATRKAGLMSAFAEKKLKSKTLIKEVQGYNRKNNPKKQKAS